MKAKDFYALVDKHGNFAASQTSMSKRPIFRSIKMAQRQKECWFGEGVRIVKFTEYEEVENE